MRATPYPASLTTGNFRHHGPLKIRYSTTYPTSYLFQLLNAMSTTQASNDDDEKTSSAQVQLNSAVHVTSAFSLQPRNGYLVPLRTKAEVEANVNLIDAYIVRVPPRLANTVVKSVQTGL